jgi:transposase
MTKLYGAIDLHSNNSVTVLLNEKDEMEYKKKLPNDLRAILSQLDPFKDRIDGIAVESTYNWYWLVDGLQQAGYRVHLVNTNASGQYNGLKYVDDEDDARWLAHLLRLGILPEGYIYPKEERGVRDLLRKRAQLVRHQTSHLLSLQNLFSRNTGGRISSDQLKAITSDQIGTIFEEPERVMAMRSSWNVLQCLRSEIGRLEMEVKKHIRSDKMFQCLQTTDGIGVMLAMTICLEAGDIRRFPDVGNYASYCRCVRSQWKSNGKKKGEGNRKNGNKYLAWAYIEAAHFAVRYNKRIQQYFNRKAAQRNKIIAIKAVAHKLARASYYVMRDLVPFDAEKAFA